MNSLLDSLFNFYLESWGWLIFAVLTLLIVLVIFGDSQRRELRVTPWLLILLFCLAAALPAAVHAIGSQELREQLSEYRFYIFTIGLMAGIVPILLFIAYWYTHRDMDNRPAVLDASRPHEAEPPKLQYVDQATLLPIIEPPTIEESMQLPRATETVEGRGVGEYNTEETTGIGSAERQNAGRRASELASARLVDMKTRDVYQLLHGKTRFGRAEVNEYRLSDKGVSAQHLEITERNHQFFVQDIGSSFGTLLNGKELTEPKVLYHGDVLTVGDSQLRFVAGED
jgi:pSer/pThr/pTyr-binding forkhead associated (FHA) protein